MAYNDPTAVYTNPFTGQQSTYSALMQSGRGLELQKHTVGSGQVYIGDYGGEASGFDEWVYDGAPAAGGGSGTTTLQGKPVQPTSGGGGGGGGGGGAPKDYGLKANEKPINVSKFLLDYAPAERPPIDQEAYDYWKNLAQGDFIRREVQPEDTVKWQMQNLLAEGSPYITQARQQGKEYAASRGLLNSSLGAQASQRAAIEAALPIAQQDASTYFSQGINNQNLANQFQLARQNAGLQGRMMFDELNAELDAQFAMFNKEMETKVDTFNSTMGYEAALAAQGINAQERLTRAALWGDAERISAELSMHSATLAAQLEAQYKAGLMDIWTNPNITPEQSAGTEDRWKQAYGKIPAFADNYANG